MVSPVMNLHRMDGKLPCFKVRGGTPPLITSHYMISTPGVYYNHAYHSVYVTGYTQFHSTTPSKLFIQTTNILSDEITVKFTKN